MVEDTGKREVGDVGTNFIFTGLLEHRHAKHILFELLELMQMTFL